MKMKVMGSHLVVDTVGGLEKCRSPESYSKHLSA
jgi:hypothetical protein